MAQQLDLFSSGSPSDPDGEKKSTTKEPAATPTGEEGAAESLPWVPSLPAAAVEPPKTRAAPEVLFTRSAPIPEVRERTPRVDKRAATPEAPRPDPEEERRLVYRRASARKKLSEDEAKAKLGLVEGLNPAQFEACTHITSPLLILAGAGSGKTRVITYRIVYLILTQGWWPEEILAVTFTNKAAGEMRERVAGLIEDAGIRGDAPPRIGTFHSTCVRILRRHANVLGLQRSFSIYDSDDSRALLRDCARRINLPDDRKSLRGYQSFIEQCKNRGDTASFARSCAIGQREIRRAELYGLYDNALREANAVDFGDLIFLTNRLFDQHAEIRKMYAGRWHHVLVDEFQDTNSAQYQLLRHLAGEHGRLTVVGDDDQSIYAWRGANVQHMLSFERDFAGARVVKLEQNYRSSQPILTVASDLIANNAERRPKRLWTSRSEGAPVQHYAAVDERDEARFVARTIQAHERKGSRLEEVGVLFRTNAQARVLEEALRSDNVPYRLVGDVSFYARAEIKDLLAYMKLIVNPMDIIALRRIINVPTRGIGAKTLERLVTHATLYYGGDIRAGLASATDSNVAIEGLRKRSREALVAFHEQMEKWRGLLNETPPGDMLRHVIADTDYLDHLTQRDPERAEQTQNNVHELLGAVLEFERQLGVEATLSGFLEQAALNTSEEVVSERGLVSLMTIHSAKGLEFDLVFVVGLEDQLLPYQRRDEEPNIEEERRLAYVAFTRARHHLVLSHAFRRRLHGGDRQARPSRFFDEINRWSLEKIHNPQLDGPPRATSSKPRQFGGKGKPPWSPPAPSSTRSKHRQRSRGAFEPGEVVTHTKFGVGEVKEVINRGDKIFIVVDFPMAGVKKVLDRFINRL